jgi:adenylate kinase
MKDLIFLGIQGCGKGTQVKALLEAVPNHLCYDMGQTLRALMSNKNLIGTYIKDVVDNGKMIDNFITHDLISTSLQICQNNEKNIIIDGFPRMMEQADFLLDKMTKLQRDFIVIHFELSKEKSLERMMKRAEIEGRKDDTPAVMEQRISIFMNETMPVIKHFETLGKVITVNADGGIDEVQAELRSKLGL